MSIILKGGSNSNLANVTAALALQVDGSAVTQPVSIASSVPVTLSGDPQVQVSNFPATQPVSAVSLPLPANAAQETSGNLAALVTQGAAEATTLTSGAQKSQVTDPTTFIGANVSAKGAQGANALAVQNLIDSGRSKVVLTLTKSASITTEALVTLTQKKGDATTTTGTSYTVTAGKTLRIQSMFVSILVTTALTTVQNVAVRLREGAAAGGAVSVASDIVAELETSATAVTAGAGGQSWQAWPDGIEIAAGQNIGISELAVGTAGDATVTIVVHGFEY